MVSRDLSEILEGDPKEIPSDVAPFDAASGIDIEQQRLVFNFKGLSNIFYGFTNPNNVQILVGGWVRGSQMAGFWAKKKSVHPEIIQLFQDVRILLVMNVQI